MVSLWLNTHHKLRFRDICFVYSVSSGSMRFCILLHYFVLPSSTYIDRDYVFFSYEQVIILRSNETFAALDSNMVCVCVGQACDPIQDFAFEECAHIEWEQWIFDVLPMDYVQRSKWNIAVIISNMQIYYMFGEDMKKYTITNVVAILVNNSKEHRAQLREHWLLTRKVIVS